MADIGPVGNANTEMRSDQDRPVSADPWGIASAPVNVEGDSLDFLPARYLWVGSVLIVAAGVLLVLSSGRGVVEQLDGLHGVNWTPAGIMEYGIAALIVAAGVAVSMSRVWVRAVGLGVASLYATFGFWALSAVRTHESLLPGEDVSLASGGWMLLALSLLALAGVVLVVIGFYRRPEAVTVAVPSRKNVVASVLGVTALIAGITGPVAVVYGRMALVERPSGVRGRKLAVFGLVLGATLWLAWLSFGIIGALGAQPQA